VDLVVNNAGVAVAGRVGTIPIADWEWIVRVNLWGVVHGCHVFVPYFTAEGRGHVLNVASAAGFASMPDMGAYSATKAAVVALSEALYTELSPLGIGVTVLCPTFFKTGILGASRGTDETQAKLLETLMAQGKLDAEGVAEAALRGVERGDLYVLPQADARWLWRVKRLAPRLFYRLAPKVVESQTRRMLGKG
jgi:short-subunit dehydrogenase